MPPASSPLPDGADFLPLVDLLVVQHSVCAHRLMLGDPVDGGLCLLADSRESCDQLSQAVSQSDSHSARVESWREEREGVNLRWCQLQAYDWSCAVATDC
jgi:hypothetical protein